MQGRANCRTKQSQAAASQAEEVVDDEKELAEVEQEERTAHHPEQKQRESTLGCPHPAEIVPTLPEATGAYPSATTGGTTAAQTVLERQLAPADHSPLPRNRPDHVPMGLPARQHHLRRRVPRVGSTTAAGQAQ